MARSQPNSAQRNFEVIPVSFNQGMQREFDTQEFPDSGRRIINWQPLPTGGLRARRRWRIGSLTGAPAGTKKVRGLGHLPSFSGYLVPYRRQWADAKSHDETRVQSIRAAWDRRTVEGNFLFAILVYADKPADVGIHGVSITAPAGWLEISDTEFPITSGDNHVKARVYRLNDAAEHNGYEKFIFDDADEPVKRAQLHIMEWANIDRTAAIDITQSDTGASATPSTGTAAITTQPQELVIGFLAGMTTDRDIHLEAHDQEWYEFLHSDTRWNTVGGGDKWLDMTVYRQVIVNEDQMTLTARWSEARGEDASTARWVAGLITIKARLKNWASDGQVIAAQRHSATELRLFEIDEDSVQTGTWTNIWTTPTTVDGDAVALSVDQHPLQIEGGMGGAMITHPDLPTSYHYDGDRVTRIRRSPSGRAMCLHRNRFFIGGGNSKPNRLYWSELGDFTRWNLEDQSSYVEVGYDSEVIYDIRPAMDGLLISKREGLYFLSGSGPSSFGLVQLAGGKGCKGQGIVPIPGGAAVAGRFQIWMWEGGGSNLISRGLDDWWTLPWHDGSRKWVTTAFANGLAYFSGGDEDTICILDLDTMAWYCDQVGWGIVASFDDHRVLWAPWESDAWSLANVQRNPEGLRLRDEAAVPMTYLAETQQLMLGSPSSPITPRHLWIAWEQRGTSGGGPGLTVTPIYDGVTQTTRTINLRAADGDYRERLDVWVNARTPVHKVQFKFERTLNTTQTAVMDLEAIEFAYEREEHR